MEHRPCDASTLFQCVNILRVIAEQLASFLEECDETVTWGGVESPWPQLMREGEERLRIAVKVLFVKHALGCRHAKLVTQAAIDAV